MRVPLTMVIPQILTILKSIISNTIEEVQHPILEVKIQTVEILINSKTSRALDLQALISTQHIRLSLVSQGETSNKCTYFKEEASNHHLHTYNHPQILLAMSSIRKESIIISIKIQSDLNFLLQATLVLGLLVQMAMDLTLDP